jgi:hypothetical protein
VSEEAYDLRDDWYPTPSADSLNRGQIPGNPDPRPDLGHGDQAHGNR